MSSLDALPPDQRAVVSLLLRQGRSYDDIAAILGMPVAAVRSRAHAGLATLGPDTVLPQEVTGPLGDYLLGQQSASDAAATRGLLSESAPARAWAAGVRRSLEVDTPGGLPEVPGEEERPDESIAEAAPAETPAATDAATPADADTTDWATGPAPAASPDAPAAEGAVSEAPAASPDALAATASMPRPTDAPTTAGGRARPGPPPSSRLGGAVLIAGVIAVVVVVAIFVLGSGSGGDETSDDAAATPTPTATPATAQVTDQIDLQGVGGSKASGRMTVFLQSNRLFFQLRARNVPPSGARSAYAVWFTGPGTRARRLGYTDPVGADGELGIQGPSDTDMARFPRLYASYAHVVVSRETDTDASRPAQPILRGPLPKGR